MITPGIYQVRGYYTSPANIGVVEVLEVSDRVVKCRNEKGKIVELDHGHCEKLIWTRIDQDAVFGRDCRDGNCEF